MVDSGWGYSIMSGPGVGAVNITLFTRGLTSHVVLSADRQGGVVLKVSFGVIPLLLSVRCG